MKKINLIIRKLLIKNCFYYLIAFLVLLYALICLNVEKKSIYKGGETSFSGNLESYTIKGNKLTFLLSGEEKLKCIFYIETEDEKHKYEKNLKIGSFVSLKGKLSNPVNNTIPNTFNYKKYLYYQGIYYLCSVESFSIDDSDISLLYKIKNFIISRIKSFENVNDYLLTFIIGDKSLLNDESMENYRKNGVTHLFAISGMHIGLFSGCILKILKKLRCNENKSYIITILFIWFYAFLTGFTSSVLRAGLLFTLLSLNKIFYTEVKGLNVLILTGSLLVVLNPYILKDIGFIYSYLTTFGLMYSTDSLKKHKIIGTSLIAMLFSLPVTINNFYEFNLLSVFINIIFVPFISVVVYPLCLIAFFIPFIEPIIEIILNILEWLNNLCANLDFLHIIVPKCGLLFLISYYSCLLFLINKKFKLCITLLFILILLAKLKPNLDSNYYLDFLDIGQGDSTLIRTPNKGEVILIDTGGALPYYTEEWKKTKKYKVSDNTITYLHSLGISSINYLILTHGDADHLGEAINIVENIKVEKVIFNCGEFNELEQDLINVLKKKNIPYYSCIKELNIDDNKFYFLNNGDYGNENDNSSVIYAELNDHKFIFMGDAGVDVEEDLIEKYNLQDMDVLKVGHHGSKTSSSKKFIDSINPKYSIISVGKNNRYGHPNKEVLSVLDKSKIYRTDQDGSIMFKIENNKLRIETCAP